MSAEQPNNQTEQYVNAKGDSRFSLFGLTGRGRATVLLLALIGQILLTSLNANQYFLPSLYQGVVILAAMFVAADSRRHLIIGLSLGLPGIAITIIGDYHPHIILSWLAFVVISSLYLFIIRLMLMKIFKARVITIATIGYALCTYVLLGSVWTLFYAPVAKLDPQAFSQPITEGDGGATLIYFSFVTLTTLGYGDISPVSPLARSLAILEALTGTLFLAVLISRLVGAYSSQRK